MAYVFRSAPTVKQVSPSEVLGTPLEVGVTYNGPDQPVTFTLDPGTAATVMQAVREYAIAQENKARQDAPYVGHYASASHRMRTVEETYVEAQFQVLGPMPTYDND